MIGKARKALFVLSDGWGQLGKLLRRSCFFFENITKKYERAKLTCDGRENRFNSVERVSTRMGVGHII